ncbi:hypothetical protein CEUSTIGMA_g8103.t1 [Chlamydomonas eustigma]|uniref:Uncharacterized protein n=1 Tax=Chlamydomonas eustigma TaxID=1157962 RepID=A0A250XC67_9CHLO|nr:hypothetical protein CEUSTIGMA_g8103.t1 [Chlamydomonas eustigma]|eukprot:GAX80668.1 hypothetical protein CEUSTIGMA_g8103.t1 [Chlamydomonas eustigma]
MMIMLSIFMVILPVIRTVSSSTTIMSLQATWSGTCRQYAGYNSTGQLVCIPYKSSPIVYAYTAVYKGNNFNYTQGNAKTVVYNGLSYGYPAYVSGIDTIISVTPLRKYLNTSNMLATDSSGLKYQFQTSVTYTPAAGKTPAKYTYVETGVYYTATNQPRDLVSETIVSKLQCNPSVFNYYCSATKVV